MNLEQALFHVEQGGKATSDSLSTGAVLKLQPNYEPPLRVVFELTGSGYSFTKRLEHEQAEWRKVEGWSSYV